MYRKGYRESWFCAPQSSKEENSEAFAGQHARTRPASTSSTKRARSRKIYEVAEGGLTDGEPMIFLFGNPTRSHGSFHEACFGQMRHRWRPVIIDSRTSRFTNKRRSRSGSGLREDSDFVRVRVLGLPPSASDLQFIGNRWSAAQRAPIVACRTSRWCAGWTWRAAGSDECVIRFRRGKDARSIPPIRVPGEQARDSMKLVTLAADVLGALRRAEGGDAVRGRDRRQHRRADRGSAPAAGAQERRRRAVRRGVAGPEDRQHAGVHVVEDAGLAGGGGAIDSDAGARDRPDGPGYFHDKQRSAAARVEGADEEARAGFAGRWRCAGADVCAGYAYAREQKKDIRDEGDTDMVYLMNPWRREREKKEQEEARRDGPADDRGRRAGQYVNQLINDVRQNKRGIKVAPAGAGSTDKTADLRQSLIRQIEYRSNAALDAYPVMFENAAQRSYGYLRIKADVRASAQLRSGAAHPRRPESEHGHGGSARAAADGSDWKFLYFAESWTKADFKRKWPKAKVQSFDSDLLRDRQGLAQRRSAC
jgi:hypothetical protein